MWAELGEKLLAGVLLDSLGSRLDASRTRLDVNHRGICASSWKAGWVSTQRAGKLSVGLLWIP